MHYNKKGEPGKGWGGGGIKLQLAPPQLSSVLVHQMRGGGGMYLASGRGWAGKVVGREGKGCFGSFSTTSHQSVQCLLFNAVFFTYKLSIL